MYEGIVRDVSLIFDEFTVAPFLISENFIPEFWKIGLAKISAHSTTWQLKAIKLVQRPIKSLYLTPGSKLMIWSLEAFQRVKI